MLAVRLLLAPLSLALAGHAIAADWILPAPVGAPVLEARSLGASATLAADGHLDVVLSMALVSPQDSAGTPRLDVGSLEGASASLAGQPLPMADGHLVSLDLEAGEAVVVELRGRLSPDRLDWLSEGEAGWFGRSRGPVLQPMSRLIVRHRDDSAFATTAVSLQLDLGDIPLTGILTTPGAHLAHGSARWESVTLSPPSRISVAWPVLGSGSFLPRTSAEAAEAIVDWQARVVEAEDVRQLATAVLDTAASMDDEPAARAAAASLSEHARTLDQRAAASRRVADAGQPAASEGPAPSTPAETSESEAAQQDAAKREAAEHEAAKHEAAKHEATQHEAAKREAAQHEAAQKEAAKREAAQQETARREAAQHEAAQKEAAKREAAQQETAKREAAQHEAAQKEAAKREAAQQETARHEAAQQEAAKREAAQHEAAQQEAAKREAAQHEAAQQDAAKREAAQHEAAQQDAAKREAAQREAAQTEAAQRDAAQREAQRDAAQRAEHQLEAARRAQELAAAEAPEPTADVPWIRDVAQARLFLAAERHAGLRRDRVEEAIAIIRARQGDPFDDDPRWRERFQNEPWYAPRDPDGLLANAPEVEAALTLLRQAI
jgi:hypothetical protein